MPVNQPAQMPDADPADQSWKFEVTQLLNTTEQRIDALVRAIEDATDLNDLKERARDL